MKLMPGESYIVNLVNEGKAEYIYIHQETRNERGDIIGTFIHVKSGVMWTDYDYNTNKFKTIFPAYMFDLGMTK